MTADLTRRTTRPLVSLIGFAALILGFVVFSIFPFWRHTSNLNTEIADLQHRIAETDDQVRSLKSLQGESQFILSEVRNYDRLVPGNQDLGGFLVQLSRELDNAGMQEIRIQALPATALGKCQQLPIEVHGTGTFAQFHQFLVQLESLHRMSSISKMTIEADTAMTGKVTVEVTLAIYNTKPAS